MVVHNVNTFTVTGRLTLASTHKLRIGGKRRTLTLGSHKLRIAGSKRRTLRFRASRKELKALKTAGKTRIKARLRVVDPAGKVRHPSATFTLRPPKHKHKHRHHG